MHRSVALLLALPLAGCLGADPEAFAHTRKPLYAGGFDLERIAGANDTQEFRVTDGSIAGIRLQVWINATSGGGHVRMSDPGGREIVSTSVTREAIVPLELGVWKVDVAGRPASAGKVHVLATRI